MFGLPPDAGLTAPLHVLALGAHSDDIEIGAGGTLLRLLGERPQMTVSWVVLSGSPARAAEARASAAEFLSTADATVRTESFRDGFFPRDADLKGFFRDVLQPLHPDLVLTHRLQDAHQDHRTVAELTWQTFRGARIAAYEIPKWEGDLGQPNAYIALDAELVERKVACLSTHFSSQAGKPWFDGETFRGLMRLRGVEAGVPYAEAFTCSKLVW
ncbi:MAG: PIG-L family deacetylase [Rubricoccaceae bacterium]